MAIYRPDQAQLSFGVESVQGADAELLDGTPGSTYSHLEGAHAKGVTELTISTVTSGPFVVGEFVRIGAAISGSASSTVSLLTVIPYEIRRIEYLTATTLKLDRPTAFPHADNATVLEVTAALGTTMADGGGNTVDISIPSARFVAGSYAAVTVPDMAPTLEPKYFLGNTSKRNFTTLYKGQQTFAGSLPGVTLLNGWMLRFPIGKVRSGITSGTTYGSGNILLNGAAAKGDMIITVNGAGATDTNLNVLDIIEITDQVNSFTGTYKISRVVDPLADGAVTTIFLETPLKEAYTDDSVVDVMLAANVSGGVFTHTITESNILDTLTWHLRMLDTDEAYPFVRRSLGGMVDTMSIAASEGEMLQAGWDTMNFMDTLHNLEAQDTSSTNIYTDSARNLPGFSLMSDIDETDIDFPLTEPYYFSQGIVYIGGEGATRQEFARIRDFSLSISNATEPKYYVNSGRGGGRRKGPSEIREGRREYTFSATVALPDSEATTGTGIGTALELYKQLLLEGDYGNGAQGFNVRLEFIRGTSDTMTIDMPGDAVAATGLDEAGVFLRSAPLPITEDQMMQTSIDAVARNIKITIVDGEPVYP